MLPPLVFVVIVSMIKDAYEDWVRHEKDKAENEQLCKVLTVQGGN